jgi:hypothetical protein
MRGALAASPASVAPVILVVAAIVGFVDGDIGWWLSWLAFLSWVGCAVVTAAKGKWALLAVDMFVWLFSYFAAFRLAKPHSLWARKRHDGLTMHRALLRYGEERSLVSSGLGGPPSRA